MTSWREYFPREYLSVDDLKSGTRKISPKVTVDKVVPKDVRQTPEMGGGKKRKLVMYFVGKKKGLLLNVGMCETMDDLAGTKEDHDYTKWKGTVVELFETMGRHPRKGQVPVIRIRRPGMKDAPVIDVPDEEEDLELDDRPEFADELEAAEDVTDQSGETGTPS